MTADAYLLFLTVWAATFAAAVLVCAAVLRWRDSKTPVAEGGRGSLPRPQDPRRGGG